MAKKQAPKARKPKPLKAITTIADLTPDAHNAREHNPRNIGMIEAALGEVGAARSIVIDEGGRILAGNGTIEAAARAGITRVQVVEADGETIVAVRRAGLSEKEKKRLALYDNRTAELATWDGDVLAAMLREDEGALSGMFAADELRGLLPQVEPVEDAGAQVDRAEELREKWGVQLGDLWACGEHRVICGDCTDAAVVARVMGGERAQLLCTDPPYGVDFKGAKYNPRAKEWAAIDYDDMQGASLTEWLTGVLKLWLSYCNEDLAVYLWTAPMQEGAAAARAAAASGIHIQSQIIWSKNTFSLGQADYQWKHETCWYGFIKGKKHRWLGGRAQTTVWDVSKIANSAYMHPMQKPVELYERAIENHTYEGEICADPFMGSGTQMVACERLRRRGRGVELSPAYVAVTLERMAALGLTPQLLERAA